MFATVRYMELPLGRIKARMITDPENAFTLVIHVHMAYKALRNLIYLISYLSN